MTEEAELLKKILEEWERGEDGDNVFGKYGNEIATLLEKLNEEATRDRS